MSGFTSHTENTAIIKVTLFVFCSIIYPQVYLSVCLILNTAMEARRFWSETETLLVATVIWLQQNFKDDGI